ncbi:hypothetical protein LXL04_034074 [Taraxacum kok-saghyz]
MESRGRIVITKRAIDFIRGVPDIHVKREKFTLTSNEEEKVKKFKRYLPKSGDQRIVKPIFKVYDAFSASPSTTPDNIEIKDEIRVELEELETQKQEITKMYNEILECIHGSSLPN